MFAPLVEINCVFAAAAAASAGQKQRQELKHEKKIQRCPRWAESFPSSSALLSYKICKAGPRLFRARSRPRRRAELKKNNNNNNSFALCNRHNTNGD